MHASDSKIHSICRNFLCAWPTTKNIYNGWSQCLFYIDTRVYIYIYIFAVRLFETLEWKMDIIIYNRNSNGYRKSNTTNNEHQIWKCARLVFFRILPIYGITHLPIATSRLASAHIIKKIERKSVFSRVHSQASAIIRLCRIIERILNIKCIECGYVWEYRKRVLVIFTQFAPIHTLYCLHIHFNIIALENVAWSRI